MMWTVVLTRIAQKEFDKAPAEIQDAFLAWQGIVETSGPAGLRQMNGYWDHALKGEWAGMRASSLNRQWRVIYHVDGDQVQVAVVRISAHDYRR